MSFSISSTAFPWGHYPFNKLHEREVPNVGFGLSVIERLENLSWALENSPQADLGEGNWSGSLYLRVEEEVMSNLEMNENPHEFRKLFESDYMELCSQIEEVKGMDQIPEGFVEEYDHLCEVADQLKPLFNALGKARDFTISSLFRLPSF